MVETLPMPKRVTVADLIAEPLSYDPKDLKLLELEEVCRVMESALILIEGCTHQQVLASLKATQTLEQVEEIRGRYKC